MNDKRKTFTQIFAVILALIGLALLVFRIPPVVLTWETASEVGTAGFNIYRHLTNGDESLVKANDALIEAQGDELTGASYRYEDEAVSPGKEYTYYIEEVEWDGGASKFPQPVTVRAGLPSRWVKIEGGVLLLMAGYLFWRSMRKHAEDQTEL